MNAPQPEEPEVSSFVFLHGHEITAGIDAMKALRDAGHLTVLRGGRPTDLARPISQGAQDSLLGFPSFIELIQRTEQEAKSRGLFLRALKFDEPRVSSTHPDSTAVHVEHLHFDAQRSSLAEYPGDIWQYYTNLANQPREFRYLPLPLPALLAEVLEPGEDVDTLLPDLALKRYLARNPNAELRRLVVPCGFLAAFNGRRFAHDAGKGITMDGHFRLADEPDLVAALDITDAAYHQGLGYDPSRPFLEDVKAA